MSEPQTGAARSFAIPPDAVRVWRGFRAPSLPQADFFARLNTVFVPATVLMQIKVGLDVYVPTVPAGLPGKPDSVPDETAILFWDSQQTYKEGFETLAVRTYTITHAAVYTPSSRADFPLLFAGELAANQPYYLIPRSADWMKGTVTHLLGARPAGVTPDQFRASLAKALAAIQARPGLPGAIACAGDDYLAYWEVGSGGPAAPAATGTQTGTGNSAGTGTSAGTDAAAGTAGTAALAPLCGWSHVAAARPTHLDIGLWEKWPGMDIKSGDSLNMQFQRRWE